MGNTEDKPLEIDVSDLTEELLEPQTGIEPEVQEPEVQEPDEPQEPEAQADPTEQKKDGKVGPLSATIRLERENRQLRRRLAEIETLRQFTEQEPPAKPAEPELSPLEKWEQENREALNDDPSIPVPAKVQLEDRQWQREHSRRQQEMTAQEHELLQKQQSIARVKADYSVQEVGEVLAFDTIVSAGAPLLTREDIKDINAVGSRSGQKAYDLCLMRLRESDPDIAAEIDQALHARHRSGAVPPKTQPQPQPQRKAPTREKVLQRPSMSRSLGLRYPT